MLCKSPYTEGVLSYPCGQCLPCRINRRRLWTSRIMLEARCHPFSSFATLTYDNDNYPISGSLRPQDCTLFFKRLRKRLGNDRKIRYYLVGEYGDQTERAHYHAALFGVSQQEESIVHDCWGHGHTMLGTLTYDSAQYIAGYVTKKLTSINDPRLNGRYPEFARMSNRPGIGALAVPAFADTVSKYGLDDLEASGDVPTNYREGGQSRPLGRYLRTKLRKELNLDEETIKWQNQCRQLAEMYALSEGKTTAQFVQAREDLDKQKRLEVTAKHKLYSTKEKL